MKSRRKNTKRKNTKKKKKVVPRKKIARKKKTKKNRKSKKEKITRARNIKKSRTTKKKNKVKKVTRQKKKVISKKKKRKAKTHKEILIGRVTHYFDKLKVAAIRLLKTLNQGDEIHFVGGENTDFRQKARSLEINHNKVKRAKKGTEVGLKVSKKVREGYRVYRYR